MKVGNLELTLRLELKHVTYNQKAPMMMNFYFTWNIHVIIFNIFIFTTKSFERGDKKSTKFFLLISNQKARVLTLQKKLKNEYLQERGEKPTVTLFGGSPN